MFKSAKLAIPAKQTRASPLNLHSLPLFLMVSFTAAPLPNLNLHREPTAHRNTITKHSWPPFFQLAKLFAQYSNSSGITYKHQKPHHPNTHPSNSS
jgi:hypothetical protein